MITGSWERSRIQRQSASPSLQKLARGVSVARLERCIALTSQVLNDHVPDRRLVVDD
jgi:hypothetical protein